MKRILVSVLFAAFLTGPAQIAVADDANSVDIVAEVTAAGVQLEAKLKAGKTSAEDIADNLKQINALIAKYQKNSNREFLGSLYLMLARINSEALDDNQRAMAILNQVRRDFAGTKAEIGAAVMAGKVQARIAAEDAATPEGYEIGQRFPGFSETDVTGKSLSTTAYRGKVVLIDFWATWCGPCVAELPNVLATYRKNHAAGFEIIGISLDSDRNKLVNFTRAQGMPWQQFFDGNGWDNKLANKYGVRSIPATYLLDKRGRIIGKDLRGKRLEAAVSKALTGN